MPKFLTAEEYLFRKARKTTTEYLAKRVSFKTADEVLAERNGSDGLNGKDGKDGRDGKVGPQGPAGTAGRDGAGFNWKGHWLESVSYNTHDVVNYLGSTYVALSPTRGSYPNRIGNEWDLMAAAGAAGANGRDGTDLRDTPHVGVPTFIQSTEPDYEGSYVWVQTGLGDDGTDYTVYYNIC